MANVQKLPETTAQQQDGTGIGRMLTLLANGAAMNMLEIDKESYDHFREAIEQLAKRSPDRNSEEEKLETVKNMVREFALYRATVDEQIRERLTAWRTLTNYLLREILECLQLQSNSPTVFPLVKKLSQIEHTDQVNEYLTVVKDFFYPPNQSALNIEVKKLTAPNLSTSNDNAAGLRGGGSAVAHMEKVLAQGDKGYIVQFELGCLDMVSQRFGIEAVQDCLIAVSSFITGSLNRDDRVYHWSDSRLLAILQGRVSEQILHAELNQLFGRSRDFMVQVGTRTIMLRIPLTFGIFSINQFTHAEDLYKLLRKNSFNE